MSSSSRAHFADAVRAPTVDLARACLLLAVDAAEEAAAPGPDISGTLRALDELAAGVRAAGQQGAGAEQDAELLRVALGEQAGFRGAPEDFADLRSSLLPDVLARRRGLPILLSIVYVEVAQRAGIGAHVIALPGRVVVGVGDPRELVMLDPYDDGRRLRPDDAAALVRTMGATFDPAQLAPAAGAEVIARVLSNIRALASRVQRPRTQLWAVELSLLLPHRPAQLLRERAALLTRLGDFRTGAQELEGYAQLVEPVDAEAAERVRWEARLVRSRLN